MKYDYAKCPVCGMEVHRHQLELEYRGMHFAFCSEQCRERFETDPHLYVGYPGHRVPNAMAGTQMEPTTDHPLCTRSMNRYITRKSLFTWP